MSLNKERIIWKIDTECHMNILWVGLLINGSQCGWTSSNTGAKSSLITVKIYDKKCSPTKQK